MVNFGWLGLSAPQPTEVDRQIGQIAKPHIIVEQHVSKLSEKSAVGVCLTLEWVGAAIVKKIEKKVKEAFALFQVCCTAHKPKQVRGGKSFGYYNKFYIFYTYQFH